MLTVFAISFLVLFIPVLFVRAAPEAAAILTGIGIIVFGFYYPVVNRDGGGLPNHYVWLGFDFARRVWCWSQRNQ